MPRVLFVCDAIQSKYIVYNVIVLHARVYAFSLSISLSSFIPSMLSFFSLVLALFFSQMGYFFYAIKYTLSTNLLALNCNRAGMIHGGDMTHTTYTHSTITSCLILSHIINFFIFFSLLFHQSNICSSSSSNIFI